MRRPDPTSPSGLEGILPYALVGVFTVLFWGATLFLWRQACLPPVECTPPNFALTIFALLVRTGSLTAGPAPCDAPVPKTPPPPPPPGRV